MIAGILVLLIFLLNLSVGNAQTFGNEITISGYVATQQLGDEKTKSTSEALLTLWADDSLQSIPVISKSGAFFVKLQVGTNYVLRCEKEGYATKSVRFLLEGVTPDLIDKSNQYFDLTVSLIEMDYLIDEVLEAAQQSDVFWDYFYNGLTYSEKELQRRWQKVDSLGQEYLKAVNSLPSKRISEQIANFKEGIEWPRDIGDTFDIGIYKDYPLFVNLVRERKTNPLLINSQVTYLSTQSAFVPTAKSKLDVLFLNAQSGLSGTHFLPSLDKDVLLVTADFGFNESMVNFTIDGNHVNYEINQIELAKRGFNASEPVLLMANITSDKLEWQKALMNAQLSIKEEKDKVVDIGSKHEELQRQNNELLAIQDALDSLLALKNLKIDSFSSGIEQAEMRLSTLNLELDDRNYAIRNTQMALRNKQKWLDETNKTLEEKEQDLVAFDEALFRKTEEIRMAETELGEMDDLLSTQKRFSSIIAFVLGAILLLLYFVYRGYRKQIVLTDEIGFKSKKLNMQRTQLAQKNREMSDSINYAKRIQVAMLPQLSSLEKHFDQSFILFEPKDVVAGDFFWMKQLNELVYFAVADCTGHGVPGAMMSILCHNALDRALREAEFPVPSELLSLTRKYVIAQIAMGDGDVMDGMDIALCAFNKYTKELQFAGAHNPVWIASNRLIEHPKVLVTSVANGGKYLHEIKGDKQPVGKYYASSSFSNHTIKLEEGDTIYIFSDGFPDQFGGKRGKKMKTSLFKELIGMIQDQDELEKQREFLSEYFINWKGDLEQVDDVCVMAVKL